MVLTTIRIPLETRTLQRLLGRSELVTRAGRTLRRPTSSGPAEPVDGHDV